MKKVLLSLLLLVGVTTFAQETIILQPGPKDGNDALIYDILPDRTFGAYTNIIAQSGTRNGTDKVIRSLLKFNFDTIPQNATIISAKLSLTCWDSPSDKGHDLRQNNATYIRRVTEDWNQDSVTWNERPQTTDENQILLEASTSEFQSYLDIDITNFTQYMYTHPEENFGVQFQLETESGYRKMLFASSNCLTAALRPKLEIEYTCSENTNNNHIYDTIHVYDTITVYDTVKVYESICDTLIIDITTKLNTPDKSISSIMIYPNPTTGTVTIENFNFSAISNYSIRIVSAQSQTIFESQINQELFSIDLSQFSNSGLYFIQVFDSNFRLIESKKILLK